MPFPVISILYINLTLIGKAKLLLHSPKQQYILFFLQFFFQFLNFAFRFHVQAYSTDIIRIPAMDIMSSINLFPDSTAIWIMSSVNPAIIRLHSSELFYLTLMKIGPMRMCVG